MPRAAYAAILTPSVPNIERSIGAGTLCGAPFELSLIESWYSYHAPEVKNEYSQSNALSPPFNCAAKIKTSPYLQERKLFVFLQRLRNVLLSHKEIATLFCVWQKRVCLNVALAVAIQTCPKCPHRLGLFYFCEEEGRSIASLTRLQLTPNDLRLVTASFDAH